MIKFFSYTLLTVLTVDLLATSGDLTMTWTSPILPKLYVNDTEINPFGQPITPEEESWISSLINIGAMIGPFPFSLISEKFGRKVALLTIAIPHIVSFLTLAFIRDVYVYYGARFLAGVAIGGGYTLLPMYIAEVAEDSNRGMLSVTLNIFWTFGNLIPYSIGPYLSIQWFNVAMSCIPTVFFVLFLCVAPETPYYLLSKKKTEKAEESLMLLRSRSRSLVGKEITHIQSVLDQDQNGRLMDLFKSKPQLKALIISVILIVLQQGTGINAVLFYTQPIFAASGSSIPPEISSIAVGVILFLSSLITPIFANTWGRRIFLIVSATGMVLSLGLFGVFFYLKDATDFDVEMIFWLPIFSLILYIVSFNFGFGSVAWTVSSELFPSSVKSLAASLVAVACWLTSFLVTKFFNDLNNVLGISGTFWLFGGCSLVALVFVGVFIPETRGKSFKEIQDLLDK